MMLSSNSHSLRVSTTSPSSLSPSVHFGSVRTHKHKRTLGDNPSCKTGPPITFEWEVEASENFELDDYEELLRSQADHDEDAPSIADGEYHHKSVEKIKAYERSAMLHAAGVSYKSMTRVYKEIQKIQKNSTKPEDPLIMEDDFDDKPKPRGLGRWFPKKDKAINPTKNITGSRAA